MNANLAVGSRVPRAYLWVAVVLVVVAGLFGGFALAAPDPQPPDPPYVLQDKEHKGVIDLDKVPERIGVAGRNGERVGYLTFIRKDPDWDWERNAEGLAIVRDDEGNVVGHMSEDPDRPRGFTPLR